MDVVVLYSIVVGTKALEPFKRNHAVASVKPADRNHVMQGWQARCGSEMGKREGKMEGEGGKGEEEGPGKGR